MQKDEKNNLVKMPRFLTIIEGAFVWTSKHFLVYESLADNFTAHSYKETWPPSNILCIKKSCQPLPGNTLLVHVFSNKSK